MIQQLKTSPKNVLAIEVIDGFTQTDEKLCQKFFQEKLDHGFDKVNVLVKLDEMKISKSSIKAFFEDTVWLLRNYTKMGHLAIVAHSGVLKALVPVDNLFFARSSKGREERYFDISKLDKAFEFVQETAQTKETANQ
ncbi:MAG TPA: STAS/SEC14 domain-containing protein [Chitinophagaceae bacterium]|nr:STAS/SEC14 domain-containing protein [Chitinophagaceae bacterium]